MSEKTRVPKAPGAAQPFPQPSGLPSHLLLDGRHGDPPAPACSCEAVEELRGDNPDPHKHIYTSFIICDTKNEAPPPGQTHRLQIQNPINPFDDKDGLSKI